MLNIWNWNWEHAPVVGGKEGICRFLKTTDWVTEDLFHVFFFKISQLFRLAFLSTFLIPVNILSVIFSQSLSRSVKSRRQIIKLNWPEIDGGWYFVKSPFSVRFSEQISTLFKLKSGPILKSLQHHRSSKSQSRQSDAVIDLFPSDVLINNFRQTVSDESRPLFKGGKLVW